MRTTGHQLRGMLAASALASFATACAVAQEAAPAPVTTAELVEIRGLSGLTVSPDGRYAAVRIDRQDLASNTTRLEWRIVDIDNGLSLGGVDAGGASWNVNGGLANEYPQWSADSRHLYFRKLTGEEMQVWRVRPDGGELRQVTQDDADILAFDISASGRLTYAAAGATRDEIKAAETRVYDEGILLDGTLVPGFPLVRSFPYNGRMATLRVPVANSSYRHTLLGDLAPRLMVLDAVDEAPRPAHSDAASRFERNWSTGRGRFSQWGSARFRSESDKDLSGNDSILSADGERIARIGNPDETARTAATRTGMAPQWRANVAGSQPVTCIHPACSEADESALIGWMIDDRRLVFQSIAFGVEAIRIWDTETGAVLTVAERDGVFGGSSSGRNGKCQLAGQQAICIAADASRPARLVAIDLASGGERVLLDPNLSIAPQRLGVSERLVLTNRFGTSVYARVVLPQDWKQRVDGGERLPVVITSYTCSGFLLGGSGEDVPEHVLAGLGYVAVCIDMAAWNKRPPPSPSQTPEQAYQSALDFTEGAVRALADRGVGDPTRSALTGFSASSTAVAYALTTSKQFAAAIITTRTGGDPISCYLVTQTDNCRRGPKRAGRTPPYDGVGIQFPRSAALHAGSIRTPLLMQLSDVEYLDMMQLQAALTDFDRAVEMRIYPDEFHIKRQPRHRLSVYDRNVEWIEYWLRGREAPGGARESQYERWRSMRAKQCLLFEHESARPIYCETQ